MKSDALHRTIRGALTGEGAHAGTREIFDGLPWKLAGAQPAGAPHSAYQLLQHMTFWQEWGVRWLDGKHPATPKHAAGSWPGGARPASSAAWRRAVARFQRSLDALETRARGSDLLTKQGTKTVLELLQAIGSHDSYHAGQVVILRQTLDAWPPPSGGATW
jgi:uncharacterized damage-inducible protein DinB